MHRNIHSSVPSRLVALIGFFFTLLFASAEPATVTVGDLTFVRPVGWTTQEPTGKSAALAQFNVPGGKGDRQSTVDVRFYIEDKEGIHNDAAMRTKFPAATGEDVRQEDKNFGRRHCAFLTLRGTYLLDSKSKPRPEYEMIAATINFGPKLIHVRILGPQKLVERVAPNFRAMVENALK